MRPNRALTIGSLVFMIAGTAGVTAQAAAASTGSGRPAYSAAAQPKPNVGQPPPCDPGNDGAVWRDPADGNYYRCGNQNGTWGWYLIIGCSPSTTTVKANARAVTVTGKAEDASPNC
jgi:hypothetical protein